MQCNKKRLKCVLQQFPCFPVHEVKRPFLVCIVINCSVDVSSPSRRQQNGFVNLIDKGSPTYNRQQVEIDCNIDLTSNQQTCSVSNFVDQGTEHQPQELRKISFLLFLKWNIHLYGHAFL